MLYFILRVLVNALAVALTLILLPGIHLSSSRGEPIPVTYLALGITFGLVNSFVLPVIILFTARLLLLTYWLFTFVIQVVMFVFAAWISPTTLTFDAPAILWITLGAFLLTLLTVVAEAITGLNSPVFDGNTRSRFYWRWLNRLPTGRRNWAVENLRVYFIQHILRSYLQEIAIGFTPFARFRAFMQRNIYDITEVPSERSLPANVRALLQDLGPTFVKFGQVVSSRAQEMAPEWRDEMVKLQSNVPPFPWDEARRIITRELKKTPEELYAGIEQEPFAAASTAQVHRATLHAGTLVVVKVQRPDIDITMKGDLNVMRDLSGIIQTRQEWAQDLDLKGLLSEFADNVLLELNYQNEMFNARQLAYNMASLPGIHVPAVYPALCSGRVLTQEFVRGVKITAVDKLDAAGIDRAQLARDFLNAMLKQVLFDGFFHADPHPGNVLVDTETSQIIFLDLGLMGNMTQEQRLVLGEIILSLQERDGRGLAEAVTQLSTPFKQVDEKGFIADMERAMKRYAMFQDEQMNLSAPMQDMLDSMRRSGYRLDPSLTLALKALFQAEEIVSALDPQLPLIAVAFEQLKQLFRDQLTAENLTRTVRTQALRSAKRVMRRIPNLASATTRWLDQYESGELTVRLNTRDLEKQVNQAESNISRNLTLLALALILAGLLVGSAIASTLTAELYGIPLSTVAFFLFLGGAFVATFVAVRILWSIVRP
jgi:ubiquinone biosynthesis protein